MKKWGFLVGIVLFSSVLAAQTMIYSASDTPNTATRDASIDLLKSSFANSDVVGTYSEALVEENKKTTAKKENTQKAVAPVPIPTEEKAPKSPEELQRYVNNLESKSGPVSVEPTAVEQDIEKNNALIEQTRKNVLSGQTPMPTAQQVQAQPKTQAKSTQATRNKSLSAQDKQAKAELDYAAQKMAKTNQPTGRFIPQAASKSAPVAPVKNNAKQPFDPNEYRPGVEWQRGNSTHFIIYSQKRDNGIGSSNMGMIFESAYDTLRRNIPWMMANKVRVFVYQDHESYLEHEPNAKEWTRALAYPTRGEVVVYDEPGKQKELKEVFTHELVHVFTQQFFDQHKTGRLMTPTWLDEGLAVYMEDQAYSGAQGGPWANDLRKINIVRDTKNQAVANFSSSNMFGSNRSSGTKTLGRRGKPLRFMPFDQFMRESSLAYMESHHKTQEWYLQAYAMVRFLLNPGGGMSPSNRMQFEQFTRLLAQGEQMRDPSTGFPMKDANGKPVYQPYSVEKALNKAYHYTNLSAFEDAFWRWCDNLR